MKILKRIIFIVVLISMSIALLFVGNGYDMYKQAIEQISVEDKIAEIKDKENYTNFSELPQMYKNAVIAVEDHRFYKDKDEILELYLNTSYFGDGYYTPKEACRGYFNKELNEMTDYECILLAGIPNAPSVYAPTKNPELAKQRQKQVMKKMIEYGYLTEEEADNILK